MIRIKLIFSSLSGAWWHLWSCLLSGWEMPIGMIKCVIRSLAQVSAIFYLRHEASWRWLNLSRQLFWNKAHLTACNVNQDKAASSTVLEIAIVGPHIMTIWKTTKEKSEEKEEEDCIWEKLIFAGKQMGRDGGRKLAPNLFLIPSCHKIETLTHLCIY